MARWTPPPPVLAALAACGFAIACGPTEECAGLPAPLVTGHLDDLGERLEARVNASSVAEMSLRSLESLRASRLPLPISGAELLQPEANSLVTVIEWSTSEPESTDNASGPRVFVTDADGLPVLVIQPVESAEVGDFRLARDADAATCRSDDGTHGEEGAILIAESNETMRVGFPRATVFLGAQVLVTVTEAFVHDCQEGDSNVVCGHGQVVVRRLAE